MNSSNQSREARSPYKTQTLPAPIDLNVNSHHYGFGALDPSKWDKTSEESKTQSKNKFKLRLEIKQRKIEELMIENRVRKMSTDEHKLKQQILVANKHFNNAAEVMIRRDEEVKVKIMQDHYWVQCRERQSQINIGRKEENKKILSDVRVSVQQGKSQLQKGAVFERINNEKRIQDLNSTQRVFSKIHVTRAHEHRRNVSEMKMYDKEQFFDSVARANHQKAQDLEKTKEKHEGQLKRLSEMEERMVTSLAKTLAMKNKAIGKLQDRSPFLRMTMEPRDAFIHSSVVVEKTAEQNQLEPKATPDKSWVKAGARTSSQLSTQPPDMAAKKFVANEVPHEETVPKQEQN